MESVDRRLRGMSPESASTANGRGSLIKARDQVMLPGR